MPLTNLFSLKTGAEIIQINEILNTNKKSEKYGLKISKEDAQEIIKARNNILKTYGRVELDLELTKKLIYCFCTSPFIHQENYTSTIIDFHEVFYYLKNETDDTVGDNQLIEIIQDFYDNSSGGSMELLIGRELENFALAYKRKNLNQYHLKGSE